MDFYFTLLNREVSCQQQMRCQDEICSMYCGACSSTCMILPNRSTQLFPMRWERMMKREWEQLLPTSLHTAYQSREQVGEHCFPSCYRKTDWTFELHAGSLKKKGRGSGVTQRTKWKVSRMRGVGHKAITAHSCVLSGEKDWGEFILLPHDLSEPRERQTCFWHRLHYQWNCTAPTVTCSQHIPERHNSASARPAYEWITGKIICCSVLFTTPQVLKPSRLAWKESCSAALLCACPTSPHSSVGRTLPVRHPAFPGAQRKHQQKASRCQSQTAPWLQLLSWLFCAGRA